MQPPTTPQKWRNGILTLLMGSLLLGGGIACAFFCNHAIFIEFRSWARTPASARMMSFDFTKTAGGPRTKIFCDYDYEFEGRAYSSDCFATDAAVLDSETLSQRFNHYYALFQKHEPLFCHVNPGNPAEAVILRTPQFDVPSIIVANLGFFSLCFIGLWMVFEAIPYLRGKFPCPATNQWFLNKPRLTLSFWLFFAFAVTAYTAFFFWIIRSYIFPWQLWFITLPCLWLWHEVCHNMLWVRVFNGAEFQPEGNAPFSGTLVLPTCQPGCPLTLCLQLFEVTAVSKRVIRREIWVEEKQLEYADGGLRFWFAIPDAGTPRQAATHVWHLRVLRHAAGIPLVLYFSCVREAE